MCQCVNPVMVKWKWIVPIASIFLFFVFPNHQDKTNPIKKTCKIKLCFCLIILVTKILCHSNIHKLYTLNCLFPHTIIYICSIITITSFVVKGDGKFLPFLFFFLKFLIHRNDWNIFMPFGGQLPAAWSWCFSHSSVRYPWPQSWEATAAHPVEFRRRQKWKEKLARASVTSL